MREFIPTTYDNITPGSDDILLLDHLGGFSEKLRNTALDQLHGHTGAVYLEMIVNDQVRKNYPHLNFKFSEKYSWLINWLADNSWHELSRINFTKKFKNFICSFNGSDGAGRQFLTAAMYKYGWYDPQYSSKNFSYTPERLDGNIAGYCNPEEERLYRKFIINETVEAHQFYLNKNGFDYLQNATFIDNFRLLSDKIHQSFVQLVSETICVSYHPYFTEKSLYPIVTKNLWIAYAQPGYYEYLEKYYGFKRYSRLFDYKFDSIKNPIKRLIAIIEMLGKFSTLSSDEWHDLYLLEMDTIEYNYEQFYSNKWLEVLKNNKDLSD